MALRAAFALALLLLCLSCAPSGGEKSKLTLAVLAQAADLDPSLLDDFGRDTGIDVTLSEYGDEDEAISMLAEQPYDLIVAGDQLLARLNAANTLAPLDAASLAGFGKVDARLKDLPFDRGNRVSVPLGWGATGILSRADQAAAFDSWIDVFDAARNSTAFAGKVAMLDEPHAALGAAAKMLGISLNSTRAAEWAKARELLARNRGTVRIDSAAWSDDLLTGEVLVAQAHSDDAVFAQSTNPNLRFSIPREGTLLWIRSLALPAGTRHKAEARRLVEFLWQPARAARASAFSYSLSPVPEAYNQMEATLARLLRAATPDDATFRRSEFAALSSESRRLVEQLWAEVKQ